MIRRSCTKTLNNCGHFFSNIDILKHISKAKHKIIVYDDEDEEYADDPVDSKHMNAYKNFMIGAMKILINNTNPTIEIESYADNFQKAADIYIKMSKAGFFLWFAHDSFLFFLLFFQD